MWFLPQRRQQDLRRRLVLCAAGIADAAILASLLARYRSLLFWLRLRMIEFTGKPGRACPAGIVVASGSTLKTLSELDYGKTKRRQALSFDDSGWVEAKHGDDEIAHPLVGVQHQLEGFGNARLASEYSVFVLRMSASIV